jgi:hemerythrin-like domain-containing protein
VNHEDRPRPSGDPFEARPADFDDPFEILEACHARIARMLRTLERLPAHVAAHGVDAEAREAIARVRRYFELAGPDHHADEDIDLFPAARAAALAAGEAGVVAELDALGREHRAMETTWAALRAHLDALCSGGGEAVDAGLVDRFAALCRGHIEREEGVVYADAKTRLPRAMRDALARAMVARRRG